MYVVNVNPVFMGMCATLGGMVFVQTCACAMLSSVACPTLSYFSTLSQKGHDFREKKIVMDHEMPVSNFTATLRETFLFLRRIERDVTYWSLCKVQYLSLSQLSEI